jgi:hypothetical protein
MCALVRVCFFKDLRSDFARCACSAQPAASAIS